MATEKTPRRLGRGLDALFSSPTLEEEKPNTFREIPINQIQKNPFQPRKDFSPDALRELEESLKTSGLLQPITVRKSSKNENSYELVAGERRLRAATQLGWTSIGAIVKELDDRELLGLALVENLQRSDLNPIEEAEGYSRLIAEFGHTQQTIGLMVGRDRSTIANTLRILQLPLTVRDMLRAGTLTIGHARPLLGLSDEKRITDLAREIASKGLSARDVEQRVREGVESSSQSRKRGRPKKVDSRSPEVRAVEERLRRVLQTDVVISSSRPNRGSIKIAFYSLEDLERISDLILSTHNPQ